MEGENRSTHAQKGEQSMLSWEKNVLLYLHDLVYLLAGIILVFLLFFRIVVVSGSSMYSTLKHGDWLLISSGVFFREPEFGDIVIASKDSFESGEPIIKRVIATEGQKVDIDFTSGIVYVDDVALVEDYTYTRTTVYEGVDFPLTVSEGCVFVMGDNRNESKDSRSPEIGLVDKREILGKALFLLFPGDRRENFSRSLQRIGAIK